MFVVVALGIAGLLAALILLAAVSDYRVASAAYRNLDRLAPRTPTAWWYVGGRVKLTLLGGTVGCVAGTALLLVGGPLPRLLAGATVLTLGALLLVAGEVTRHRLVSGRQTPR